MAVTFEPERRFTTIGKQETGGKNKHLSRFDCGNSGANLQAIDTWELSSARDKTMQRSRMRGCKVAHATTHH